MRTETCEYDLRAVDEAVDGILRPYQVESDFLGPSKISTYLQCPRAYKIRYVDKADVPQMAPAAMGSAIHSVIAYAHKRSWDATNARDAADMLEAIWGEIEPLGKDEPNQVVAYRQARDVWVPWYLAWQARQNTILVEERWRAEIPGTGVVLQGTADRLYLDPHGAIVCSDVKSGARAPTDSQLATNLQFSLYTWGLRTQGVDVLLCEYVHLRGLRAYRTTRSDEYLEAVLTEIVLPVAQAIDAGLYPAHPGSLYGCNYCVCRGLCPIGGVTYGRD